MFGDKLAPHVKRGARAGVRRFLAGLRSKIQGSLTDPGRRVLARLDQLHPPPTARRAMLFESWTCNPLVFELLLLLFDSEVVPSSSRDNRHPHAGH
jgi:hypothetical protein